MSRERNILGNCVQVIRAAVRAGAFCLFLAAFLLGMLLILARLSGWQTLAVRTGSMQEQYPVGTLLIVDSSAPEDIQVGDVVSFVADEQLTVVTHRVAELHPEEQYFITKGDSNNTVDSNPVLYENLIGRVQFGIPLLGYAVLWLQESHAQGALYIVLAVIFLIMLGRWALLQPDKRRKER